MSSEEKSSVAATADISEEVEEPAEIEVGSPSNWCSNEVKIGAHNPFVNKSSNWCSDGICWTVRKPFSINFLTT